MPHSSERLRSSENALALTAMMGSDARSGSGSARMARVAA